MKDEITIGLNGKTIASFGIDVFKGITPIGVKSVSGFKTSNGVRDNGESVLEIGLICVLEKNCPADYVEKKVTPIEPMVVVETPVQKQMGAISNPVPLTTTYNNELPIKTRKPRGPNKPKEPIAEESVFDKPKEEAVVEEKKVPVSTPVTSTVVSQTPITSVGGSVLSPPSAVSTPMTPARINELAKLIKMWCKASALKIETVTIALLKAQAFDIVENDADVTIEAGIKEAARLMQG